MSRHGVTHAGILGALQFLRRKAMDETDQFLFISNDIDPGMVRHVVNSFSLSKRDMVDVLEDTHVCITCRAVLEYYKKRSASQQIIPPAVAARLLALPPSLSDNDLVPRINAELAALTADQATELWSLCSILGDSKPSSKGLAGYFANPIMRLTDSILRSNDQTQYKQAALFQRRIIQLMMDQCGRCFKGCKGRNVTKESSPALKPAAPPRTKKQVLWNMSSIQAKLEEVESQMEATVRRRDYETAAKLKGIRGKLQQALTVQEDILRLKRRGNPGDFENLRNMTRERDEILSSVGPVTAMSPSTGSRSPPMHRRKTPKRPLDTKAGSRNSAEVRGGAGKCCRTASSGYCCC
mgnify:FL=1